MVTDCTRAVGMRAGCVRAVGRADCLIAVGVRTDCVRADCVRAVGVRTDRSESIATRKQ